MLRAVALAARLGFTIHRDTLEAVRFLRGEIVKSSPARILDELYKILRQGASRQTFQLLHDVGLLAYLLPEAEQAIAEQGERLLGSLARLDDYRNAGLAAPDELTNSLLMGTLVVPLGVPLRRAAAAALAATSCARTKARRRRASRRRRRDGGPRRGRRRRGRRRCGPGRDGPSVRAARPRSPASHPGRAEPAPRGPHLAEGEAPPGRPRVPRRGASLDGDPRRRAGAGAGDATGAASSSTFPPPGPARSRAPTPPPPTTRPCAPSRARRRRRRRAAPPPRPGLVHSRTLRLTMAHLSDDEARTRLADAEGVGPSTRTACGRRYAFESFAAAIAFVQPRGRPGRRRGPPSGHPRRVPERDADPDLARRRRPHRARLRAGRPHRRLKALVTGADGQLGRELVPRLAPRSGGGAHPRRAGRGRCRRGGGGRPFRRGRTSSSTPPPTTRWTPRRRIRRRRWPSTRAASSTSRARPRRWARCSCTSRPTTSSTARSRGPTSRTIARGRSTSTASRSAPVR